MQGSVSSTLLMCCADAVELTADAAAPASGSYSAGLQYAAVTGSAAVDFGYQQGWESVDRHYTSQQQGEVMSYAAQACP